MDISPKIPTVHDDTLEPGEIVDDSPVVDVKPTFPNNLLKNNSVKSEQPPKQEHWQKMSIKNETVKQDSVSVKREHVTIKTESPNKDSRQPVIPKVSKKPLSLFSPPSDSERKDPFITSKTTPTESRSDVVREPIPSMKLHVTGGHNRDDKKTVSLFIITLIL